MQPTASGADAPRAERSGPAPVTGPGPRGTVGARTDGAGDVVMVVAPAKLTVSLRITGVRPDGYHTLDAEMVSLDLYDELRIDPGGDGLTVVDALVGGLQLQHVDAGPANLVHRALQACGRRAGVTLVKRIPTRGGLGGGSSDAGAVLRWAGVEDPEMAVRLGADVPFCVHGGRARVRGIGEQVTPLPFEDRRYVLLLPPVGVDTAACYRAWDALAGGAGAGGAGDGLPAGGTVAGDAVASGCAGNDLERPALVVAPELAPWRDRFGDATGRTPRLAGSGSTWFVEGTPDELGLEGQLHLQVAHQRAPLVAVRTVPAA